VTVATAVRTSAPYLLTANGAVEPLQNVAVQSQVGGILTDVTFKEGDDVQTGQVLFRIDPRPYQAALAQAEAVLARDRAQALNAQHDAQRFQILVAKDYVTRQQADQAQAAAAAQQASVDADRAAVENARFNLENATIRAPISGRTGSLLVKRGNLVRPTAEPLVTINQIHPIVVRFAVPARELSTIQLYKRTGSLPVRILSHPTATPTPQSTDAPTTSTALPAPAPESGTLSFLDNTVDTTTGTVMLKATFPNRTGSLWPGEFVTVQLQLFVEQNVVAVPTQALTTGQTGQYVFIVDGNGTAQQRSVTAGRSIDSTTTIIQHGVQPGERVVTDGQSRLYAGAKVEVRPSTAPRQEPTL
jgi:multidrug efflux system membrane fusion protein